MTALLDKGSSGDDDFARSPASMKRRRQRLSQLTN
jgi:hypothetical protein